jgi:signal recognition particle subunit SRP54
MASRILGGGDIATLLEKAQREFDADEMEDAQRKMAEGRFSLDDFRKQMQMINRLGPLRNVMKMIPGLGQMADVDPGIDMDKEVNRIGAMIDSMTLEERRNPDRIDRSRRNRIAAGSGTDPADINKLLKDFSVMGGMMQGVSQMGMKDRLKAVQQMAGQAMSNPAGRMMQQKQRSKRGPLDEVKAREKEKRKKKEARKQRKRNR